MPRFLRPFLIRRTGIGALERHLADAMQSGHHVAREPAAARSRRSR